MSGLRPGVFESRSPNLSRREARQVQRHLNFPLFVPETGRHLESYIARGAVDELLDVLGQLSAAGSAQAASLQVYLAVIWGYGADHQLLPGSRARCLAAAQSGDCYAMYVTAWVCRSEQKNVEAMRWMTKAASRDGFLPAFVDLGRFAASGIGYKSPDLPAAYSIFRSSHRLGHRLALGFMATSLRMGAKGLLGRLLGFLLWLPASIRFYLHWGRYPLSERVFVTPFTRKRPLFRTKR